MQLSRRRFGKLGVLALGAALLPLELLTGCPGEDVVLAAVQAAAQIAAAASGVLRPLNASTANVLDVVAKDLLLIINLYDQYKAADATAKPGLVQELQTIVGTIGQNLTAILAAVRIGNPGLVTYISVGVGVVNSALAILINHLPAQHKNVFAATADTRAKLPIVPGAGASDLKKAWNDASIKAGHPEAIVR